MYKVQLWKILNLFLTYFLQKFTKREDIFFKYPLCMTINNSYNSSGDAILPKIALAAAIAGLDK